MSKICSIETSCYDPNDDFAIEIAVLDKDLVKLAEVFTSLAELRDCAGQTALRTWINHKDSNSKHNQLVYLVDDCDPDVLYCKAKITGRKGKRVYQLLDGYNNPVDSDIVSSCVRAVSPY